MNNKIVSTKSNAIFLATVLVLGTIAIISPSFIVGAQAEPYYGMDDRYDSYEAEYTDNNNYEPEYPSYKPNHPSDNSYKSKDSSSTIVKKVNCNNINSNNNGVDINLGIPNNDALVEAQAADEGQATTANGYGYVERNGYKQNDNDFRFVCVNNNDNENNIVVVNETTPTPIPPPPPSPDTITCEECFTETLTPGQIEGVNAALRDLNPETLDNFFGTQISVNDLAAFCTLLSLASTEENLRNNIFQFLGTVNSFYLPLGEDIIEDSVAEEIVQCILEALNNEV